MPRARSLVEGRRPAKPEVPGSNPGGRSEEEKLPIYIGIPNAKYIRGLALAIKKTQLEMVLLLTELQDIREKKVLIREQLDSLLKESKTALKKIKELLPKIDRKKLKELLKKKLNLQEKLEKTKKEETVKEEKEKEEIKEKVSSKEEKETKDKKPKKRRRKTKKSKKLEEKNEIDDIKKQIEELEKELAKLSIE